MLKLDVYAILHHLIRDNATMIAVILHILAFWHGFPAPPQHEGLEQYRVRHCTLSLDIKFRQISAFFNRVSNPVASMHCLS